MARRRPAEGCVRQRALRRVRLRQQRLGRDLSVGAALDRRAIGGAWRAQRLCAWRGRRPQRPRRRVRALVRGSCAPLAAKEFGVDSSFSRSADDAPLYQIEPVAPSAVNPIIGARRRCADEGSGQSRAAEQERPQCVRPLDPPHRGEAAGRHDLPGRRPSQRRAAQRSGAGRFGHAPVRLPARRPDPAAGRRRPPRAIAGRRRRIDRAAVDRLRRAAAGRDPQADPDHGGTHALSGDQAEAAGLCRRRRGRLGALPVGRAWESANRCSTCWRNIRPANCRSTPISKCCRCWRRAIIRSRRRRRSIRRAAASPSAWSKAPASSGRGIYKGVCSNYLAGRRAGETDPRHGARDQGRLPAAGRPAACRSS